MDKQYWGSFRHGADAMAQVAEVFGAAAQCTAVGVTVKAVPERQDAGGIRIAGQARNDG